MFLGRSQRDLFAVYHLGFCAGFDAFLADLVGEVVVQVLAADLCFTGYRDERYGLPGVAQPHDCIFDRTALFSTTAAAGIVECCDPQIWSLGHDVDPSRAAAGL